MKKEVNWAIIGCGDVTEVKSGPGLYKSEHSNLVAVYNRTTAKAVDYAKRHNVSKVYKTVSELLDDDSIDIVYIATPPKYHKDFALQVLNANKIPYVEKPVANTYAEFLEIKELSEKKNIPVYIAFYRRGLEKYLKIKELLDSKVIGDVRFVSLKQLEKVRSSDLNRENLPWRLKFDISGGGKFVDMGVHMLDYLSLFFGNITEIKGSVSNQGGFYDVEDTVLINYKFESGIIGTGTFCYVSDKDENLCEILGSEGRIYFDVLSGDSFTIEKNGKKEILNFEVPEHIAMPYEQAIVNEVLGIKKCHNNIENALALSKAMDDLMKSYRVKHFNN
ncbi:MAG: Gfo/Idh/MocA family protein [Sphaerochaeta sp.]